MSDVLLIIAVIAMMFVPIWLDASDEKRRRTAPERSRRRMRDLEHRLLLELGAEDLLRRMLIEDLRQIRDRRKAVQFIREHHGVEIQWPFPKDLLPLSFWARTARSIRAKLSDAWAAR